MAVTYVNAGAANATTITIPSGHQGGDLLVMWAFNNGSTTLPTVPTGWTSLATGTGTLCAGLIAYRVAGSSSETSGTWTTATHLVCNVYRGQATNKVPLVSTGQQTGTSTSISYSGITTMTNPGTSLVAQFSGMSVATDNVSGAPPTSMTNRADIKASGEVASFDTNTAVSAYTFNSQSVGANSGNWISRVVEIRAEQKNIGRNAGLRPHAFSPGLAR